MRHFVAQNTPKLKETISVANNACWAIGELAVKVKFPLSSMISLFQVKTTGGLEHSPSN